jgi:hypothetical protein
MPVYGWRVVAANNRPLGRSARHWQTFDQTLDDARRLYHRLDDSVPAISFHKHDSRWSWSLTVDGETVATSVNRYLRRAECVRALTTFVDAVSAGEPETDRVRPNRFHSQRHAFGELA